MNKYLLLAVFIMSAVLTNAGNNSLIDELDQTINQRNKYIQAKESKIAYIKEQIKDEREATELLKAYNNLFIEYYVFKFDSAMVYADKGLALALRSNNKQYQTLFQLNKSDLLAIGGLYEEALDIINSIDSAQVEQQYLFKYYVSYFTLYSYKTTYCGDTTYSPQYKAVAHEYLRKAIQNLSPEDSQYDYYMGEKSVYLDNDHLKARQYYQDVLHKQEVGSRDYARSCYALAGNYLEDGDKNKYEEYMIRASLSDIKSATMENAALHDLALFLFQEDESNIERSDRYINVSMEDAKFYNNRLRMIQNSRILPQIVAIHQKIVKQQNEQLRLAIIFISSLLLGFVVLLYYVLRQNRLLTLRRKELAGSNEQLSELNKQLHQLNGQLVDTNTKRENLASIYIDLCAKYIDKLGKYQTFVKRKIKANQAQELLQTISSTRISEEDAATFLNRFDKAFLELYPTFVEEFNALLSEDGRIQQKSSTALTTELRTFALVRLGVKNTVDIAGLLFLSPQTIYNCRSVIKNRAINKETFDEDVQKLCSVIRK